MSSADSWRLWIKWVAANAIAELVGLGATFAIGMGVFAGLPETPGTWGAILSALLMTASGVIEGVVVGVAQWRAMQPDLKMVTRRAWIRATVVGALAAWFLGSLPMTIASLSGPTHAEPVQEPEAGLMLSLASGMGLVAGFVLGFPQWRVLRHYVQRAWLWLPANGVAWAAGMPIIFAAVDLAQKSGTVAGGIVVMAVSLAVAGAVVGGIHGGFLTKLAASILPES